MLLSDYLTTNDLWGAIGAVTPFNFILGTTPTQLNVLQGFKYGERTMTTKAGALPAATLATIIVNEYFEKWTNLENVALANLNPLAGKSEKTTEDVTNSENRTTVKEDLNKVSAFNSDVLVTNDGANSTGTDGMDGLKNRVIIREITDMADVYKNLTLLEKNAIIQTVTKDVTDFVTLSIY